MADCLHRVKVRLLGYDPRLWQCGGNVGFGDIACGQLFVEGHTSRGEPAWLPLGVFSHHDICCGHCLDGFCTSVDEKPCDRCDRTSARRSAVS